MSQLGKKAVIHHDDKLEQIHSLFGKISQCDASVLILTRWSAMLADGKDSINEAGLRWLEAVGGLDMSGIRTEKDLLMATISAPSDLLFGLAYGKFVDAMAYAPKQPTTAYPIPIADGRRAPLERHLVLEILDRGYELQGHMEAIEPAFTEKMSLAQSRSSVKDLRIQVATAPHPFLLGMNTSWLITHLRSLNEKPIHLRSVPLRQNNATTVRPAFAC